MKKKNILIIGGGQQIGYYLNKLINHNENNIYHFNRGLNQHNNIFFNNHIKGDRNNNKDLSNIPKINWDIVIDTCCYKKSQIKKLIRYVNNMKKLIFISSIYIYYIKKKLKLINPQIKKNQYFKNINSYSKNKLECENFIANNFKKKFTIIRPGPIIGKYDYSNRLKIWKDITMNNNFTNKMSKYEFQIVSGSFVAKNIIESFKNNNQYIDLPGSKFSYVFFYNYIKKINSLKNHKIDYDKKIIPYLIFDQLFPGKKEAKNKILELIKRL